MHTVLPVHFVTSNKRNLVRNGNILALRLVGFIVNVASSLTSIKEKNQTGQFQRKK